MIESSNYHSSHYQLVVLLSRHLQTGWQAGKYVKGKTIYVKPQNKTDAKCTHGNITRLSPHVHFHIRDHVLPSHSERAAEPTQSLLDFSEWLKASLPLSLSFSPSISISASASPLPPGFSLRKTKKKKKKAAAIATESKGRPGPGLSPLERPDWWRPAVCELCCRVDGEAGSSASVAVDAELSQQSCQGGFTPPARGWYFHSRDTFCGCLKGGISATARF